MLKSALSAKALLNTTAITRLARASTMALAGLAVAASPALAVNDNALPTGGTVASGDASFNYNGNTLGVNQNTNRVIIDWESFNIGEQATTQFYQPGTSSIAVNRIHDVSPSQILGNLRANGQLVLLNTNGVFFGANSKVDVGGLLASTGKLDSDLFNSTGQIKLTDLNTGGKIENQGTITIANAGLAAFVAPHVANSGVINAPLGKIALASGANVATVDLYGDGLVELALDENASQALIDNTGTLKAEGGVIAVTAKGAANIVDSVINMGGIVEASSATQKGGKIILDGGNAGKVTVTGKLEAKGTTGGDINVLGQFVSAEGSAIIDASGTNGGGNIKFGGAWQGGGDTPTSEYAYMGDSVVFRANATENGDGGEVVVWSDLGTGVYGLIEAKGGANSGNGGDVEVSSLGFYDYRGLVDTTAANGQTGNFLLDPLDILIRGGTGDGDDIDGANPNRLGNGSDGLVAYAHTNLEPYLVTEQEIEGQSAFSNITIQARRSINTQAGAGLDNNVTLAANRTLTIETRNNAGDGNGFIDLSNLTFTTQGTGSITVQGSTGSGVSNITVGNLTSGSGGTTLTTDNGSVTINGLVTSTGAVAAGASSAINVNSAVTGSSIAMNAPTVNLEANLNSANITGTATTVNVNANGIANGEQINDGIDVAASGATVNVGDGNYNENVVIDKNVKLQSINGRGVTTIMGQGNTALGTVLFTGNSDNAQLGDIGKGFTIIGIDNASAGIESAAVYLQGNHSGNKIIGNDIVANGDSGLISEYASVTDGLIIDSNIFSGQTFAGANPAGDGFGQQFTLPNVPRQLVVIGGGTGGGNTSNVTFTNNEITGTAGGLNGSGDPQGNTLVTIDSKGAVITGNTFAGTTSRYGASLRARGENTLISGNTFYADGLTDTNVHIEIGNGAAVYNGANVDGVQDDIMDVWNSNTFVGKATVTDSDTNSGTDYIGLTIQGAVNSSTTNANIYVNGGATYNESVNVNKAGLNLYGANSGIAGYDARGAESIVTGNSPAFTVNADNVTIDGFLMDGVGLTYGVLLNDVKGTEILNNIIVDAIDAGIGGSVDSEPGPGFGTLLVENNWIHGGGDGINIIGDPSFGPGDQITGVVIDIIGNEIGTDNAVARGIVFADDLTDGIDTVTINIADNTVEAIGAGVLFSGEVTDNSLINITGNSITGHDGVEFAQNVENSTINITGGNTIIGTGSAFDSDAIDFRRLITNSTVNINNNTLIQGADDGIQVIGGIVGGSFTVDGNASIIGLNGDGIALLGLASGGAVGGNAISDGAQVSITDNTIEGQGPEGDNDNMDGSNADGILISGNITGVTTSVDISDNTRITGYNHGIHVFGNVVDATVMVNNNDLIEATNGIPDDANNHGIFFNGGLDGATVKIVGNTHIFAEQDGIRFAGDITGDTDLDIANNENIESWSDGIAFHGEITDNANVEILSNDIDAVTGGVIGNGIAFYDAVSGSSLITIDGNTIEADEDGIVFFGPTSSEYLFGSHTPEILITQNSIVGADFGIVFYGPMSVEGHDIEISNNSLIRGNGNDGIAHFGGINNSELWILDNAEIFGHRDGIHIEGDFTNIARITIEDNTDISTNNGDGIEVLHTGGGASDVETSIARNRIHHVGNHGIEMANVDNAMIADNVIGFTDMTATTSAGNNNIEGDGIFANNSDGVVIVGNKITQTHSTAIDFGSGIQVINTADAQIKSNTITNSGWDGIRLQHNTNVTVEDNEIDNVERVGIWGGNVHTANIKDNTVQNDGLMNYGSIHADGGSNWSVTGNDVDFGDFGIFLNGVGGGSNLVDDNMVDNVTAGGIRIESTSNLTVSNNKIGENGGNVGGDGIYINPSSNVFLIDNIITDVGGYGININGQGNGYIQLAGNVVNILPGNTGARFESGEIDFSDLLNPNTFNGGDVGMLFDPGFGGDPLGLELVDDDGIGGFGGTIGSTIFNGQIQYYVQLANGAFFQPGTPTLLNGYDATFDGKQVAAMTFAEYVDLLAKIHDFNDENTLGLFFPLNPADINDILPEQRLGFFGPGAGPQVTILGLPLSTINLAGIAPAAGGEEGEEQEFSAYDLNELDTAAGSEQAECWGQVYNHFSGAPAPVTYTMDTTPDAMLNAQATCGSI